MSFDSSQIVVSTAEWEAHQVDEPFLAPGQMPSQAQQALAVLAKGVESDGHGPTIGPEHLIALEENITSLTIFSGVATKKNS
jgi:hypothetical protein